MFKNVSYEGFSIQNRLNVSIRRPSLIWVLSGEKKLFIKDEVLKLSPGKLLLINTKSNLTIHNTPINNVFFSKEINFFSRPKSELLNLSKRNVFIKLEQKQYFVIELTDDLKQSIELLHRLDTSIISHNVQIMIANFLYMQLAEKGLLHALFPIKEDNDIEQKLCLFFSNDPSYKHNIINSCKHLGLSKATLIRKLNKKNTKFKLLLRHVRMNHTLHLMQRGYRNIDLLALDCGYQSSHRFKYYFKEQFNMTLKEYMSTLDLA